MTSPCFGGVRFFTDRFTSELATRKVFRSADADPDQEKPGEDFWLLLTFLANFRVILNSFPFVFLGPQTKILKEETFDSSNNNVVVALAGKVFICLFWDKKVDKKVGWKGMLFRMSKTYNPYSSSFRVYHGQEAVGGGPPCWMWVKHFSGQPVLLVSQTLPTLDCPLEDMDLSFQPCFFFFLWSIPPKWFFLVDCWTQKGAGVFTFRCIHWSPISRPVFGLWICFNRNFRTPCRWCHRPMVDSLIRRPNNRQSHFVCRTSSGNPLLCRSGWAGLHGIRNKSPKNTRPSPLGRVTGYRAFCLGDGLVWRILFEVNDILRETETHASYLYVYKCVCIYIYIYYAYCGHNCSYYIILSHPWFDTQ